MHTVLSKITNRPYSCTLLHVPAINRHTQGDTDIKERSIYMSSMLILVSCIFCYFV